MIFLNLSAVSWCVKAVCCWATVGHRWSTLLHIALENTEDEISYRAVSWFQQWGGVFETLLRPPKITLVSTPKSGKTAPTTVGLCFLCVFIASCKGGIRVFPCFSYQLQLRRWAHVRHLNGVRFCPCWPLGDNFASTTLLFVPIAHYAPIFWNTRMCGHDGNVLELPLSWLLHVWNSCCCLRFDRMSQLLIQRGVFYVYPHLVSKSVFVPKFGRKCECWVPGCSTRSRFWPGNPEFSWHRF